MMMPVSDTRRSRYMRARALGRSATDPTADGQLGGMTHDVRAASGEYMVTYRRDTPGSLPAEKYFDTAQQAMKFIRQAQDRGWEVDDKPQHMKGGFGPTARAGSVRAASDGRVEYTSGAADVIWKGRKVGRFQLEQDANRVLKALERDEAGTLASLKKLSSGQSSYPDFMKTLRASTVRAAVYGPGSSQRYVFPSEEDASAFVAEVLRTMKLRAGYRGTAAAVLTPGPRAADVSDLARKMGGRPAAAAKQTASVRAAEQGASSVSMSRRQRYVASLVNGQRAFSAGAYEDTQARKAGKQPKMKKVKPLTFSFEDDIQRELFTAEVEHALRKTPGVRRIVAWDASCEVPVRDRDEAALVNRVAVKYMGIKMSDPLRQSPAIRAALPPSKRLVELKRYLAGLDMLTLDRAAEELYGLGGEYPGMSYMRKQDMGPMVLRGLQRSNLSPAIREKVNKILKIPTDLMMSAPPIPGQQLRQQPAQEQDEEEQLLELSVGFPSPNMARRFAASLMQLGAEVSFKGSVVKASYAPPMMGRALGLAVRASQAAAPRTASNERLRRSARK